jgi:hypothetical protein
MCGLERGADGFELLPVLVGFWFRTGSNGVRVEGRAGGRGGGRDWVRIVRRAVAPVEVSGCMKWGYAHLGAAELGSFVQHRNQEPGFRSQEKKARRGHGAGGGLGSFVASCAWGGLT